MDKLNSDNRLILFFHSNYYYFYNINHKLFDYRYYQYFCSSKKSKLDI